MTGQDKISILITFTVGVLLGAYVYVAGFMPTYGLPDAVLQDEYSDLVIIADAYGSCAAEASCLSFQLLQDGSYRALVGTDKETQTYTGSIPRRLRLELAEVLSTSTLSTSISQSRQECYFGDEATNLRFIVTVHGSNYQIDSCTSDIDYSGAVWSSLYELFATIATDGQ